MGEVQSRTQPVKLVADVAVVAAGQVLWLRYSDVNKYDHQRGWFLPDDYLSELEHPDSAARRILAEQLGWAAENFPTQALQLGFIESFRGGDRSWHMVFHYRLQLDSAPVLHLDSNVAEAQWFGLEALPDAGEVAHHGWGLDVLEQLLK